MRICRLVIWLIHPYKLIVRGVVTGNSSQLYRVAAIIPCTIIPVGDAGIRIGSSVSICINHPRRACIWRFFNCRSVNIYRIVGDINRTRPVGIINVIHPYIIISRNLPDLLHTRAGHIGHIVSNIGIINNGRITYNSYRTGMRHVIVVYTRAINITLRRAYPIVVRHTVTAAK